ncbi:MAG TPA: T9SS type A sorting domain-containing protein [Bacteroidales bacterium]|nr:T9SS type A sorting domain-containing protein [Bacteroidales bacterium]
MKKIQLSSLLITGILLLGCFGSTIAQTQLNNSGFENWENEGTANVEPLDWNSFKTSSGTLSTYASQQINKSSVVRPGTTGISSCLIWSKSIIGVVANGNVTTGQINMGNIVPTHADNYNISHIANTAFSEALAAHPDSIVFWARYIPSSAGGSDSARMRAVIHDAYDLKDPLDASSQPHVVGDATINFASTDHQWSRISIPFNYTGPATTPDYMLITFTTNKTPGGGSGGDSLYIDDLSLVYNPSSIMQNTPSSADFSAYTDNTDLIINLSYDKLLTSKIELFNINGQCVYKTQITAQNVQHFIGLSQLKGGIYIVSVTTDDNRRFSQKVTIQ